MNLIGYSAVTSATELKLMALEILCQLFIVSGAGSGMAGRAAAIPI